MKSKAVLMSLITLLLIACGGGAEPTQVPSQAPTAIPEPTAISAPTAIPEPTATPAAEWEEITSEEGWFSISMPSEPAEQQQNLPDELVLHSFMAEGEQAAYAVMYSDFPEMITVADQELIEQLLDDGRDGALTNMSGTLVGEESVSLGDHPGRHIVYDISEQATPGGGEGILRVYLVDGRLFQLMALGVKGELPAEDVERFLKSFQVLEHAKPSVSEGTGPEAVLQTVFDAATTGDFETLANLCDPLGENDGDTQMICDLSTVETDRESFLEYFSKGKIVGEAVVNGDSAEVPFLFGPDGDAEETMGLIQRDGTWYLLDF